MKPKMKIKIGLDFLMSGLLLVLMAYQITGQVLHEWFGVSMFVLFVAHNILNAGWYKGLFRGKYTALRVVQTAVNVSVLAAMLCLGYSGMVMSRHVFAALPVNGPMATARIMHLAASYWGFVLMSVHLGMHWGMITGMLRRLRRNKLDGGKTEPVKKGGADSSVLAWLLRFAATAAVGYGAYCFYKANIFSYMFLQAQFVFFDFEKGAVLVLAEYAAMMALWVFVGFYGAKGLRKAAFGKSVYDAAGNTKRSEDGEGIYRQNRYRGKMEEEPQNRKSKKNEREIKQLKREETYGETV